MPPQYYILTTLADILVGREATSQQRERVKQLSVGAFGRMLIHPKVGKKDANERTPLVYEGDEATGGTERPSSPFACVSQSRDQGSWQTTLHS